MRRFVPFIAVLLMVSNLANAEDAFECPLDYPPAVLKNGGYRINKKERVSHEHATLSDTVRVDVEGKGCEYSVYDYRFTIARPMPDQWGIGREYTMAIDLLTLLEKSQSELKFDHQKRALRAYRQLMVDPALNQEIRADRSLLHAQFYDTVTVSGDLEKNPAVLVITTSSGPY